MLNSTPDSLGALLGGCLAASVLAGDVIRAVVADGVDLAVVNKADGDYDPQTVADRRAQQRMVFALRRAFPKLRIVGEEGELAAPAAEDRVECSSAASALPALPDTPVDWKSLVVWMDPLDGTKRFAAGKFDEVSVLLGITVDQRPVAGVVHLPFLGKHGTTFWGGPGIGVFRSVHGATAAEVEHAPYAAPTTGFPRRALTVTVSSTNCDLVNAALRQLAPGTVLTGGATGTMVLGVITGISDAFFRFKAATRKWDICAVEALLLGLGGALVDASGKPYRYDPDDEDQTFDNPTGLLACLEPRLLASMLAAMAEVKLTRALDDREMDADWLNEHAGLHREVESVRVVSGSVRRGKHSHVATLEVQFRGSNDQHRLFLKRSVRSELPPRSETHWTRDLASYRTEARFYAEFYPSIVAASVPLVPVRFTAHSADQFLLLLDHADCSGLACVDRLDVHHAQLALRYLASLHAAACQVDGLLDRAAERLWPTGGWWELAKRGQQELEQATTVWPLVLASFERELTAAGIDTQSERIVNLGARMVQHAGYVHRQLVSDAVGPKTLVHGDFKAANLLFGASGVTAFDWQWTGVGLGAMDVAYLLNTSVGIEALEDEQELIRVYYEALDERVGLQQYPLAAFERHCRLTTLEYGRILLSNFWKGMTPQSCAAKAANANCGLGYRSVAHVVRMVRVLDAGLAFVEHEQQQQQL